MDLSTNNLVGDLPSENIARVKIKNNDTAKNENTALKLANGQKSCGIITIVGQSFMAQYRTVYKNVSNGVPIAKSR